MDINTETIRDYKQNNNELVASRKSILVKRKLEDSIENSRKKCKTFTTLHTIKNCGRGGRNRYEILSLEHHYWNTDKNYLYIAKSPHGVTFSLVDYDGISVRDKEFKLLIDNKRSSHGVPCSNTNKDTTNEWCYRFYEQDNIHLFHLPNCGKILPDKSKFWLVRMVKTYLGGVGGLCRKRNSSDVISRLYSENPRITSSDKTNSDDDTTISENFSREECGTVDTESVELCEINPGYECVNDNLIHTCESDVENTCIVFDDSTMDDFRQVSQKSSINSTNTTTTTTTTSTAVVTIYNVTNSDKRPNDTVDLAQSKTAAAETNGYLDILRKLRYYHKNCAIQ